MSKNDAYVAGTQEQRVEHWISQLEAQTQLLLSDIDIEEISHKERLNLALKMMSQLQHFLAMQQRISMNVPANNNVNAMLDNLMRQMRGEANEQVGEAPIVYTEVIGTSDKGENEDEDGDVEEGDFGW